MEWNRDDLGKLVREAWTKWALEQPDPKPSWLVSWDHLDEPMKEADRRIGIEVAEHVAQRFIWEVERMLEVNQHLEEQLELAQKALQTAHETKPGS